MLVPQPSPARAITEVPPVASIEVARHLADAVRFKTVSYSAHAHEAEKNAELDAMRDWIDQTYPNFKSVAPRDIMGKSLLYTWKGANPDLPPILLMAHMDVVPVVPGTEVQWTHGPFSGDIADGFVWGRGSIDDKGSLICILEAAERLAAAGFVPARTVMFAFGQDEEVGGSTGAAHMANALAARGLHFAWVLDEGGTLQTEPYPGVHQTIAFVAVAEKGYLSLDLIAHGMGGHSSRPTSDLAIGRLAQAVTNVVHHPFASGLDDIQRRKLEIIAPYTPFGTRLVLGNLWLTGPIVVAQMNAAPDTAARLHTTISPTIIDGGIKDNVIPPVAHAVFNFRIHPRDTIASVTEHVRDAINDPKVDVRQMTETQAEASKVSDMEGDAYKFLVKEIQDSFGGVPVAPDTVTGATDSRHYLPIAAAVFRLDPFHFAPEDLGRVHGTNERLAVSDLGPGVAFYMRMLKDLR
jgi:carboxypeptidase PM20D1